MAAPTVNVDICNMAMDHLGSSANITNIDTPETEEEKRCSRWYDATRRALLRKHPWPFAKIEAQLSRDATYTSISYADAYNLPNNYLRLVLIGDDSVNDYKREYDIQGRQILMDNSGATSINVTYIKDEDNVAKFDSLFVDLFAVEMAWRMAYKFTLKPSLKKLLESDLITLRLEAKAVSSQERPPKRISRSKLRAARRSLTSNVAGKYTVFES